MSTTIRTGHRRALLLAMAFSLIAAVTFAVATEALGDGNGGPLPPGNPDEGWLHLRLDGSDNYFEFDPAVGADKVENLGTTKKCLVTENGPDNLVTVATPSANSPGKADDGLGAWSGGSKGTPCGQLDSSEGQLIVTLAGALDGKEIDYVELDFEGKHDAVIWVDFYVGSTVVESVEAVNCLAPAVPSDCGPDSGDGDNFRFVHAPASPATAVGVYVTNGEVSLEGGADGTSPGPEGGGAHFGSDSLFHITDVTLLDCGDDTSVNGGAGSATVTRGANEGEEDCSPKTFTYDASFAVGVDPQFVDLDQIGANTENGTFLETIVWAPIEPDGQDVGELLYDDGYGERAMEFCKIDPRDPGGIGGLLDGLAPADVLPGTWNADPALADHTSCLVVANFEVTSSVTATHTIYNWGDGRRSWA